MLYSSRVISEFGCERGKAAKARDDTSSRSDLIVELGEVDGGLPVGMEDATKIMYRQAT